jgi:predicted DNA-binding transcriptional regulator YafY
VTVDALEHLQRLLTVIPVVANNESVMMEEMECRAGVDRSTVLDDVRAITDRINEPRGFGESIGIDFEHDRVSVRSSHCLRPKRITVAEPCALELGLPTPGAGTPPDERSPIDRARGRLQRAIVNMQWPAHEGAWEALSPAHADDGNSPERKKAVARSIKVRSSYRGANDTAGEKRVIHPDTLAPWHGIWVVAVYCERSDGIRFFRADRIETVLMLGDIFDRQASFSIEELLTDGKPFGGASSTTLVVHYSPRITRWIAEPEGMDFAVDGSLTIEHPLADERWAVRHVLQYMPDAEVLPLASVRVGVRRTFSQTVGGLA